MRIQHLCTAGMLAMLFFSSCKKEVAQQETITPQPTVSPHNYDEAKVLRVPGNYQEWDVPNAPKIVASKDNGEYEGYINFTRPDAEFWLVKGTDWSNVTTYNETGNYTFGHNGTFFTVPNGAGVYKINASTNTYKWSCTRIDSWSVLGTVNVEANRDADMVFDPATLSWTITGAFLDGDFIFRANKSNQVIFGHNIETGAGVPDYNGGKIRIPQAGNYSITLSLQKAGNYVYSVKKNA